MTLSNKKKVRTRSLKVKTEWVMVETLLTYRLRYAIEVPKGSSSSFAISKIQNGDVIEFDQKPLEEIVLNIKETTKQDAIKEFRTTCSPCFNKWTDDQIAKNHLTEFDK